MSEQEKTQEDDIKSEYLGLSEKTRQILQRGKLYLSTQNWFYSFSWPIFDAVVQNITPLESYMMLAQ